MAAHAGHTAGSEQPGGLRGWLGSRSITFKLGSIVVSFVLIVLLLVAVFGGALALMTGIRAYVRGEALYTNGQKDAVYYLDRYARTQDASDYRKYREAISIPLGDALARREMLKPDYDHARAVEGLLQGGNHPDDIPYMIFLFRWFGEISYFAEAISLWTLADRYVEQLLQTADTLHAAIRDDRLRPADQERLLSDIERINARITPTEIAFSRTLNRGARWVYDLIYLAILSITLVLLASGLIYAWRISRGMRRSIDELEVGVAHVAKDELSHRIPMLGNDELGRLAQAFNSMMEHRQQASEEIERQREFLAAVLENLSEGVVACDEQGSLSFFNRATREIHGLSEWSLPPEEWAKHYSLYHADGETPMRTEEVPLYRAYQGERVTDMELVIAPNNLPVRYVVASGQPIVTADGRKLGAVVAMHDITERKRAEQDLMQHAQDLARSNAELEQFAYVASHDLQEPLRTVSSYTQLLARRYRDQLDEDADSFIEFINAAVHRMRDQIAGLLDYSRVSRSHGQMQPTDLNQVIRAAEQGLKTMIDETGAQITHDDLPTLPVYAVELGQVFQNLLVNAMKFRGEASPRVHVGAQRDNGEWVISVTDNGIGVAPEHADKIFKLYQRLHARERYPGSGIGLALCRKIVERHGGRIWVAPAESGSVFRFTLPADSVRAAGSQAG